MTTLERHQRYNYSQWLDKLHSTFKNVVTFSYKGYDAITYSGEGKGMNYKLFKDGLLIRERKFSWCPDPVEHIKRYIDEYERN